MQEQIKVWDLAIRLFHWLLVIGFLVAYLTEEDFLTVHVWAGYSVMGLVVFRIVWGFIGGQYARFSNFVRSPVQSAGYLLDALSGRAKRYVGHNPAGGAMIVLLLLSLVLTTVTGLAVYGAEEHAGPLADVIRSGGEFWEETHEFFANFTVLLVVLHIAGVILESRLHKENLIKSMFTGYKSKSIDDRSTPVEKTGEHHG